MVQSICVNKPHIQQLPPAVAVARDGMELATRMTTRSSPTTPSPPRVP